MRNFKGDAIATVAAIKLARAAETSGDSTKMQQENAVAQKTALAAEADLIRGHGLVVGLVREFKSAFPNAAGRKLAAIVGDPKRAAAEKKVEAVLDSFGKQAFSSMLR